jgi:hypothetical protein
LGISIKNESGKDIYRGFGSADIAASVRSILMVEMDKHRNRFVRAIKSNFDESDYTPVRLVLDADRRLHFAEIEDESEEDEPAPPSKTEIAMSILETMLVDDPVPVSEIHTAMAAEGISNKTAQRARQRIGAISGFLDGVPVWQMPQ